MAFTSKLGTATSKIGENVVLALGAFFGSILSASNTLTLTQQALRAGRFSASASNTLVLTQTDAVQSPISLTASNTLSLTQNSSSGLLTRSAYNELTLTQLAQPASEVGLTAGNTLNLTQSAAPGLLTRSAYNELELSQSGSTAFISIDAIVLTASNTLTLTQSNNRIHCLATAIALTGSSTLTLTQNAIFPIELTANSALVLAQSSSANPGKSGTSVLELTQTVIANHWRSLTASNTLNLEHGVTAVQFRNGIPITNISGDCDITRQYFPIAGSDTTYLRPVPPAVEIKNDVVLYYPSTGPECQATDLITLRTPNFGDRDQTSYNRINRESRGGTLQIFRDPTWPKQQTLLMDFSALKDSIVPDILTFLETTLGQKISFRDWNGRLWTGVIINPDTAIVDQGVDRNDLALEIAVDQVTLELRACNTLNLTQSGSVELIPV